MVVNGSIDLRDKAGVVLLTAEKNEKELSRTRILNVRDKPVLEAGFTNGTRPNNIIKEKSKKTFLS